MALDIKNLAQDVSAASAAAQTAVECDTSPFIVGGSCISQVSLDGVTGTPTIKIQGSADGSTWSDLVTITDITQLLVMDKITVYEQMRLNVTVAGSAGTVTAYLLAA